MSGSFLQILLVLEINALVLIAKKKNELDIRLSSPDPFLANQKLLISSFWSLGKATGTQFLSGSPFFAPPRPILFWDGFFPLLQIAENTETGILLLY